MRGLAHSAIHGARAIRMPKQPRNHLNPNVCKCGDKYLSHPFQMAAFAGTSAIESMSIAPPRTERQALNAFVKPSAISPMFAVFLRHRKIFLYIRKGLFWTL